jgi:hypothetical protein
MPRLSLRLRRPAAGFFLLLHLAVAGAWTSHAVTSPPGAPTPHVEATGTADGMVAHDHRTCAVCQASATAVVVAAPAPSPLPTGTVTVTRLAHVVSGPVRLTTGAGHPRAPPEVIG